MGRIMGDKQRKPTRVNSSGVSSPSSSNSNSASYFDIFTSMSSTSPLDDAWAASIEAMPLDDWTNQEGMLYEPTGINLDLDLSLSPFESDVYPTLYNASPILNQCHIGGNELTDVTSFDLHLTPPQALPTQSSAPISPCLFSTPSSSNTSDYELNLGSLTTQPEVSSWIKRIENLSNQYISHGPPLDELLRLSQALLPGVQYALDYQKPFADTSSTLLLVSVCLSQLLVLFERSALAPSNDLQSNSSPGVLLHLGGFQVDTEAQRVLQAHVVSKQMANILAVTASVTEIMANEGSGSPLGPKTTLELLVEDVKGRAGKLMSRLREGNESDDSL